MAATRTQAALVAASRPRRVLQQFRVVANAMRTPMQRKVLGCAISDRKLLALSAVNRTPGIGVNAIARELEVRQPTASQLVKALATLHLIEVRRDSRDRRAVHLHPSAEGRALLHGLPSGFDFGDRLPLAIRSLDAESISSLEHSLAELLECLHTVNPTPDGADTDRRRL